MKRVKLRPVKVEAQEDDFELQRIWPQLSKVLKRLIVDEVDKAVEVLKVVACRRKFEMDQEKERIKEQRQLMLDQVKNRDKATIRKVVLGLCCCENNISTSTFTKREVTK